jgi:NADH-quinone oxidoreductase subunit H
MISAISNFFAQFGTLGYVIYLLIKILVLVVPLTLIVAALTLLERRFIGMMQSRWGPLYVGWKGILQPFADVGKLILKELTVPDRANKLLFKLAPLLSFMPAVAAWAVMPLAKDTWITNIDAGMLYIMSLSAVGIYGVILGGWSSNSRFAFLGAMRSAAQLLSYELAMGFALAGVLLMSGTLNLEQIIVRQAGGIFSWNWLPLFPLFAVYFISGIAECNRHPFDMAEGESELVAGFHVEYSGMGFGMFFLAEYMNMMLISAMTATMFLGGWMAPVAGLNHLTIDGFAPLGDGFLWLALKVALLIFIFFWGRATFPRYRYDQIMRLGWKVFIPLTLGWIVLVALVKFWAR